MSTPAPIAPDSPPAPSDADESQLIENIEALLREDRMGALVRLISPKEVGDRALVNEPLRLALVRALAALHWLDANRAMSFYGFISSQCVRGPDVELFEEVRSLQESWADVNRRASCPEPLARLIRLARVVSPEDRQRMLTDVHGDAERDPACYQRFFAGFTFAHGDGLIRHVRACLAVEGYPERIAIEARRDETRAAAAMALREVDRGLRSRQRKMILGCFLGPLVIFGLGAALTWDLDWLSGVVAVLKVNFWMLVLGAYKSGYKTVAGPRLFELARVHGIGQAAMLAWVIERKQAHATLDTYEDKLEKDASVCLAALLHASAQGADRLRELYGEALMAPPPLSEEDRVAAMTAEERGAHEADKQAKLKASSRRDAKIFAIILLAGILLLSAVWFVPRWL